jgi:hypothetical protein
MGTAVVAASKPGQELPYRLDGACRVLLLGHVPQVVEHDAAAAGDP